MDVTSWLSIHMVVSLSPSQLVLSLLPCWSWESFQLAVCCRLAARDLHPLLLCVVLDLEITTHGPQSRAGVRNVVAAGGGLPSPASCLGMGIAGNMWMGPQTPCPVCPGSLNLHRHSFLLAASLVQARWVGLSCAETGMNKITF